MRNFLLLAVCAVLLVGCASEGGPVVDASGPRGALNDPGAGTLNSPATSPGSSGLSGGTIGSNAASETDSSNAGRPIRY